MAALRSSAGIYLWKNTGARLEFGEELMTRANNRSGDSLRMMMNTSPCYVYMEICEICPYTVLNLTPGLSGTQKQLGILVDRLFY